MSQIPIIFEDEYLVIANKPSGIASIPERNGSRENSFVGMLESQIGQLFVVHRIDKQTSGILCFAKTEDVHKALSLIFENREVEKEYFAVVKGNVLEPHGIINEPLAENPARPGTMKVYAKGKEAISEYWVNENFKHAAWLRVKIYTGRMHQIRVHLKSIGHPLLVDEIYTGTKNFHISSVMKNFKQNLEEETRPTIARTTLHAAKLGFIHPITKQSISVEAPLPKDFEVLLKLLRKNNR